MYIPLRISGALLIFAIFLSNCCKNEDKKCCSCLEASGISDQYIFPIQPGMEEWANFNSHQEMVDACQIPDFILHDICTSGIVDTYLKYPLLFTIFAFNNINEGLDQVYSDFNGFREFLLRNDCSSKFITKYENISPSDLDSTWTTLERGKFKQLLQFMEITLGYGPISQKLNSDERKRLIRLGLEKLTLKENNNYSWPSRVTNLYVIATTLIQEDYKPFSDFIASRSDLQLFLNGYLGELVFVSDVETIKNFAISYLEQL
jgi:hypothetical protein